MKSGITATITDPALGQLTSKTLGVALECKDGIIVQDGQSELFLLNGEFVRWAAPKPPQALPNVTASRYTSVEVDPVALEMLVAARAERAQRQSRPPMQFRCGTCSNILRPMSIHNLDVTCSCGTYYSYAQLLSSNPAMNAVITPWY